MRKKTKSPGIIKTGIILFLITGIAALILASVNNITAPMIAANETEKQMTAMTTVLPDAEKFDELTDVVKIDGVFGIYAGKNGDETVGYAVLVESMGYGGAISMVVGVDMEEKITGVDITNQSETPGLGANCAKDEFKNQFVGKTSEITVAKNNAKENQIDAITSATITSKAVTKGVNIAVEAVKNIEGGNE